MKLINSPLVRSKCYVNGEWVEALSGKTFQVLNPANCEPIHSVPDMVTVDCEIAVAAADTAFKTWSTTAKDRSILLRKWYNILDEHSKELASIITAETGKPLKEALSEVAYGNSFVDWFSEEARRVNGEVVPSPANKQLVFIKQPIGVVSLITPAEQKQCPFVLTPPNGQSIDEMQVNESVICRKKNIRLFKSSHSGAGQQKRCVRRLYIGVEDGPGRLSTYRKIVDKDQEKSRTEYGALGHTTLCRKFVRIILPQKSTFINCRYPYTLPPSFKIKLEPI
ncbi:Succinate-semialdehyde dehydrogenase, mitochondrial [Homalodisca vitripennis]|nr:Succinate-semialdehyde dehydrogenase, mitochondrial [Homalodisca vitripennis]